MKQTVTVTLELEIHGHDARFSMPSFYEDAATITDERTPISKVGRSCISPFVFYLFAKGERGKANGSFVATVNLTPMLHSLFDQWPTLDAEALAYAQSPEGIAECEAEIAATKARLEI
jgi:hypothetical protein